MKKGSIKRDSFWFTVLMYSHTDSSHLVEIDTCSLVKYGLRSLFAILAIITIVSVIVAGLIVCAFGCVEFFQELSGSFGWDLSRYLKSTLFKEGYSPTGLLSIAFSSLIVLSYLTLEVGRFVTSLSRRDKSLEMKEPSIVSDIVFSIRNKVCKKYSIVD